MAATLSNWTTLCNSCASLDCPVSTSDTAVLADMSSKLRKDGVPALDDLKGLSEAEMKMTVAALNLNCVQFNKLFKAASEL